MLDATTGSLLASTTPMNTKTLLLATGLTVGAFVLSACAQFAGVGQSETSTSGGETLAIVSDQPLFVDSTDGTVSIDATVIETAAALSGVPIGDGSFDTNPIPGSVVLLGESGDLRAARWKETMSGSIVECEGWFSSGGSAWSCGDEPAPVGEPLVEYQVTCRSNGPTETTLFSLDPRVVALRADLSDGSSTVAIDPAHHGLVALVDLQDVRQVFAQTADGLVYVVESVVPGLICANIAVARPAA